VQNLMLIASLGLSLFPQAEMAVHISNSFASHHDTVRNEERNMDEIPPGLFQRAHSAPASVSNHPPICIDGVPISYPTPENSPKAQILTAQTSGQESGNCYRLSVGGFKFNLAVSGSFYHQGDAASLLNRFGAISSLRGINYWSIKDGQWQTLILDASALDGKDGGERGDFSAEELKTGAEVYFSQQDNRSSGAVTYLMRIEKAEKDRLILSVTNVSSVNFLIMPIFSPGELKAIYVLEKLSGNQWGYFNFVGNQNADSSSDQQEKSSLNRAIAFYRHFTGIPTDKNPPFAP